MGDIGKEKIDYDKDIKDLDKTDLDKKDIVKTTMGIDYEDTIASKSSEVIVDNPDITTKTVSFEFNCKINIRGFSYSLRLNEDGIVSVQHYLMVKPRQLSIYEEFKNYKKNKKKMNLTNKTGFGSIKEGFTNSSITRKYNNDRPKKYKTRKKELAGKDIKKKKKFINQTSAYVIINDHLINIKIFPNGKIHLTGCKNSKEVNYVITNLKKELEYCSNKFIITKDKVANTTTGERIVTIDKDPKSGEKNIFVSNYTEILVVSCLKANYPIERKKLHSLLVTKYKMYTTFQPHSHGAVKTCFKIPIKEYRLNKKSIIDNFKEHVKDYKETTFIKEEDSDEEDDKSEIYILFFRSGKLRISSKSGEFGIISAYNFVKKFMIEEFENLIDHQYKMLNKIKKKETITVKNTVFKNGKIFRVVQKKESENKTKDGKKVRLIKSYPSFTDLRKMKLKEYHESENEDKKEKGDKEDKVDKETPEKIEYSFLKI